MQAIIRIHGNKLTEIVREVSTLQIARGIAKRNLREILYLNGPYASIWIDGEKYVTISPDKLNGKWEEEYH